MASGLHKIKKKMSKIIEQKINIVDSYRMIIVNV